MLYFSYPQETLKEIPGEISLAISISGCSLNCNGCHSPETFKKDFGDILTRENFKKLLKRFQYSTCVLFYGGEWNFLYLTELMKLAKNDNKKVALYSGEEIEFFKDKNLSNLNYLKVGRYIEELGGLESIKTNQRLFKIVKDEFGCQILTDITNLVQGK